MFGVTATYIFILYPCYGPQVMDIGRYIFMEVVAYQVYPYPHRRYADGRNGKTRFQVLRGKIVVNITNAYTEVGIE
jgi:hypothetical protein